MKKFILTFFTLLTIFLPPIFQAEASVAAPIKILLVPGHDNEVWGAQFGYLKEADMNLVLATKIYNILKKDPRFEVYITRDDNGYTKEFADYFSAQKDAILVFRKQAKEATQAKITSGDFVPSEVVYHNAVTENTAIKLYGINKWANENKMDAVIHVHFNDYPRPYPWTIGKYRGFAVYMPEGELPNSIASSSLALDIFKLLKTKYVTSTYPQELGGLIFDQKLIALGSNGSLNASVRSVLIEYGYIYRFRDRATRWKHYTAMAELTSAGIKKYFFKK